ncbi:MAG: leucine-rich repeat domain-containing protein [Butyrivibrio sp.]|nr:leucine-rich repeat domain-containing protein [Butyrivibrio sp.]
MSIHFKTEIKTDRQSNEKYIEVKGSEGLSRIIDIPGEIESLPVRVIGNHAFSSRKDIEEIHIPDSVTTILGFAFHNCGNLRKIVLTDSVTEYLDGSTRQCENLDEIEVTIKRGNYQIIRSILGDNDRRLRFRIHMPYEKEALLVFPGFNYDFVENTMARTIQFAIEGTGYAYRECVKSDTVNFREYDNMFSKTSADDPVTAEMIAIARLSYPCELLDEAREMYENWLRENAAKNLTRTVKSSKDAEDSLQFYIKRRLLPFDAISDVVRVSVDYDRTVITSLLMEYRSTFEDNNLLELDF